MYALFAISAFVGSMENPNCSNKTKNDEANRFKKHTEFAEDRFSDEGESAEGGACSIGEVGSGRTLREDSEVARERADVCAARRASVSDRRDSFGHCAE